MREGLKDASVKRKVYQFVFLEWDGALNMSKNLNLTLLTTERVISMVADPDGQGVTVLVESEREI